MKATIIIDTNWYTLLYKFTRQTTNFVSCRYCLKITCQWKCNTSLCNSSHKVMRLYFSKSYREKEIRFSRLLVEPVFLRGLLYTRGLFLFFFKSIILSFNLFFFNHLFNFTHFKLFFFNSNNFLKIKYFFRTCFLPEFIFYGFLNSMSFFLFFIFFWQISVGFFSIKKKNNFDLLLRAT